MEITFYEETWNVRTLLGRNLCKRPEHLKSNIDIAAISETRLMGTEEVTEAEAGYTLS